MFDHDMHHTSDLTEQTYSKNHVAKCSPDFSPWLNTTLHSTWLLFFFPFTWHTEPKSNRLTTYQ